MNELLKKLRELGKDKEARLAELVFADSTPSNLGELVTEVDAAFADEEEEKEVFSLSPPIKKLLGAEKAEIFEHHANANVWEIISELDKAMEDEMQKFTSDLFQEVRGELGNKGEREIKDVVAKPMEEFLNFFFTEAMYNAVQNIKNYIKSTETTVEDIGKEKTAKALLAFAKLSKKLRAEHPDISEALNKEIKAKYETLKG